MLTGESTHVHGVAVLPLTQWSEVVFMVKHTKPQYLSAEEAVGYIASGHRIFMTGNCSVPQKVLAALVERAKTLSNVELTQVLVISDIGYVAPELAGRLRVNSMFISTMCARPSTMAGPTSRRFCCRIFRACSATANVFRSTLHWCMSVRRMRTGFALLALRRASARPLPKSPTSLLPRSTCRCRAPWATA